MVMCNVTHLSQNATNLIFMLDSLVIYNSLLFYYDLHHRLSIQVNIKVIYIKTYETQKNMCFNGFSMEQKMLITHMILFSVEPLQIVQFFTFLHCTSISTVLNLFVLVLQKALELLCNIFLNFAVIEPGLVRRSTHLVNVTLIIMEAVPLVGKESSTLQVKQRHDLTVHDMV